MDNITAKVTEHGEYDYGYDDLYRLTGADNPVQNDEGFSYDAVGNRLTAEGVVDNWSYNDNNELQGYAGITFEYDDNGNMTKKTDAGQVTNYIYNVEDRLERVEDGSGSLISTYYYDPFGRRLWKEVNGVRTYFVYADEGVVAEVDAAGNVIKSYGYKPGSTWTTDPLFMKVGGQYYFYQNDHLGTPQKLTAVNGAVVWSAKYSSFGEADVDPSSSITNNLRFPGQYFDQETGLNYNYHRYYNRKDGRYLREDPIGFKGGVNLFTYVSNNPIRIKDPFGLRECEDCPGGRWDRNVGGSFVGAAGVGHSMARVTFTCKSNGAKCSGVLNCWLAGVILEASFGWSIDTQLGGGRTVSGMPSFRDVENYDSGWKLYISASIVVGASTTGNDITITVGAGGGIGGIRCIAQDMTCYK